jgi:hypothetical protein
VFSGRGEPAGVDVDELAGADVDKLLERVAGSP